MSEVTIMALASVRERGSARKFLDCFIPHRESLAEEYEYPQYSESPLILFDSVESLLDRLESEATASYYLAWKGALEKGAAYSRHAFIMFTTDEGMIVGASSVIDEGLQVLSKLKEVVGARWGMVTGDECPPDLAGEFIMACRQATLPRLVDGDLLI